MSKVTYLHFWGKAQGERKGEPAWHPNAYHCLDVAAVADLVLRANPLRIDRLAGQLAVPPDTARTLLVTLIALHDIGKFSAAFQAKVPEHYPDGLRPWPGTTSVRHDETGSQLRNLVRTEFGTRLAGWSGNSFGALWNSIAGHHGRPRVGDPSDSNPRGMLPDCQAAARCFAQDCLILFPGSEPIPRPDGETLAALSWAVAGLTVVADWVGSNRDWFPYCKPDRPLADYWPVACKRASIAVAKAGLLPASLPPVLDAQRLLPPYIASALSPLQSFAATVELPPGPILAIIEDVTGSGKTEAALLLAARIMKADDANGVFFALPTMATANAMYARLGDAYRKMFADDAAPSLVLAHGKQALHSGFQDSILASSIPQTSSGESTGNESGAACAAWIADSRRKAFLAHVGVGTIDQALLSVLPSKFQSLRLWGLAGRVLVIDEAHAYDSYMSKEIETLLTFHAALGGSAIILSATLPLSMRRGLAMAYGRGLGFAPSVAETSEYPLMTIVGGGGCAQHPVETREDRNRLLPVRRIGSAGEAITHIERMSEAGCTVAWIRNSVDDAIEAIEALQLRGLTPVLLHARFAMGDRIDIERQVTDTLGRNDLTGKRKGFVVVGTQILQESLDYDVDGMIIDLAPIDLMIQRAGRLWRHSQRDGTRPVTAPELLVLSPDPSDVRDKDWCRQISKRSAAVYDHHGIVWRSAKALFDTGHIATPEGVRALVEQVYADDALNEVPEPLRAQANRAEGTGSAARSFANANLLRFAAGYAGSDNQTIWTDDTITPTRLGQPVTVFRLGTVTDGEIHPLCKAGDGNLRLSWALSEVSIARNRADGVPAPTGALAAMVEATKAQWSPWERDQPLLVLERDGDRWRGVVSKTGDGDKQVRYCNRIGFRIVEA